jgi:signal transduction histidine kinase
MSLQATESVVGQEEEVRHRLHDSVGTIDGVIRDLRNYIFGLGPGGAADQELGRALHDLADEFRRGSDVAIRVEVDPEAASYLASAASHVLQAAREALSNAVRHGEPNTIALSLVRTDREVVLEVEDDGRGFDPNAAHGGGRGLSSLHARAEALSGHLEIRSEPGRGTTTQIRVVR